jgi:hypothetical protein
VGFFDGLEIGAPVLAFVEVVGYAFGVEDGEGCRVEWVLWDRDENAGVGSSANYVEEGVDACRGTGGEVDVFRIGWVTVSS